MYRVRFWLGIINSNWLRAKFYIFIRLLLSINFREGFIPLILVSNYSFFRKEVIVFKFKLFDKISSAVKFHTLPSVMADGAEIITLDSDDEADTSNNTSEQPRFSGGGMAFDPANYADLMSKASQSRFMAPLVRAMANERQVKPKSTMSGTKKFPKRPGVFPPFALFTQEHREKLMQENKELSFADVGRTLGEMWHKLTDTEKEDYRTRAKDLTEKKLKAWQEQVLYLL